MSGINVFFTLQGRVRTKQSLDTKGKFLKENFEEYFWGVKNFFFQGQLFWLQSKGCLSAAPSFSLLAWGPILKFQFRCTACVSPWTTFCINTNPILSSIRCFTARLSYHLVLMSIAKNGISIDLVNDRFSFRFKKSSYFESIFCCIFTPFFCISIIFQ